MNNHVLYTSQDTDAPDCIKDNNGDVVLALCKVCNKREIQLNAPCTPLNQMKKFNINDNIYVQITDAGWIHLMTTVGSTFINNSILPYKKMVNDEVYYKLQCHSVFDLLQAPMGSPLLFNTTVLISNDSLHDI